MPSVFLSYRRLDTFATAERLCAYLTARFGSGHVFRDIESIPLAANFRRMMLDEVEGCDVFVAVIGPSWLSLSNASGRRRIDNPADPVRLEIERALQRGVPIFIVLVAPAECPSSALLPAAIADLAERPIFSIRSDHRFDEDAAALASALLAAPPAPRRRLSMSERLAAARQRATHGALLGAFAGIVLGAMLGSVASPGIFAPRDLACAMEVITIWLGTAVIGWKWFRYLGAMLGLLLGPLAFLLYFFVFYVVCCLPAVSMTFLLSSIGWQREVGELPSAVWGLSGGISQVLTITVALWAAGMQVRRPLLAILGGAFIVSIAVLASSFGVVATFLAAQKFGNPPGVPLWLEEILISMANLAGACTLIGAVLGASIGWLPRVR